MSAHAAVAPDIVRHHTNTGIASHKLGMWLFLASDAMGFIGLMAAYIILRTRNAANWPIASQDLNIPLVTLNTFLLIISSVTMVLALQAQKEGKYEKFNLNLLFTAFFGFVFVVIQGVEWYELLHHGYTAPASLFGATFYVLTGFHGFHVLMGVVALISFWTMSCLKGNDGELTFNKGNTMPIETLGLYWHFVDLVWIILFTVIYLM